MSGIRIDLNSDVGEGYGRWRMGDDAAIVPLVSSVNVACGLHAGDPVIMASTVELAARHGVSVGAHPGINDLWGFGRRLVSGENPAELAAMVAYQVGALTAVARCAGVAVRHVKLHGSLSNAAAVDGELASALGAAIAAVDPALIWYVPAGSAMTAAAAAHGLTAVAEAFVDRAYTAAGTLQPRSEARAVLLDPDLVAARAVRIAVDGVVEDVDGNRLELAAQTLCVHGDTPAAAAIAAAVRSALEAAGVAIEPPG